MEHTDARGAIIEMLTRPHGRLVAQRASTAGWTAEIRSAGGAEADASTIRFLKERTVGDRQLHAVEFRTVDGQSRRLVIGTQQDSTGAWRVSGMAGGSGGDPPRDRPWVNLAGWGWPDDGFWGGGKVIGRDCERAARVRLRFDNGVALEDTVTNGLVLFIAEAAVQMPASVEIADGSGLRLAIHSAF